MTLSAAPGGRREAIVSLAQRSRTRGVSTHLICLDQLGSPESSFTAAFNSVHALRRRSMYQGSVIRTLRRLCQSLKIDVIHTHDAASQFSSAMLRLTVMTPKIVTTF